jgi:regulator of sirC expression with transglutaminase-like and TPR domain
LTPPLPPSWQLVETPEITAELERLGQIEDAQIDLASAALLLGGHVAATYGVDRYTHHLKQLASEVKERHEVLLGSGAADDASTRLASLKHVLHDSHGYIGDTQGYNDLQNANLLRVIDRSKGLPISLAILYIHAGRAQGWEVVGLNIPGHFLCRVDYAGQRILFDPFEACRVLSAADLRLLVKRALGPQAELSASYYEAATNREILLRLQNNIKSRLIDLEEYAGALSIVEQMRKIDPGEYRLLLDAGVLYARIDQPRAAIEVLAQYIGRVPNARDRREAELLLRQLRESLH